MHKLNLSDSIPSPERVAEIIAAHNRRFGIPMDYDRMLEYYTYYNLKAYNNMRRVIDYIYPQGSKPSVAEFKDNKLREWLIKSGVRGLKTTDKGSISVAADTLLEAAKIPGNTSEQVKILELCAEAKQWSKRVDMFGKVMDSHHIVGLETWDGHRMIVVHPLWVPQNTGRLGARDPAVMNFSKDVGDIFTVPKGYVYFEADSGQIDPRITQSWLLGDSTLKACTMAYNDAYYGYIHYCKHLTQKERDMGVTEIKPLEITDEQKAMRAKFKTFGNAVMYGSTENEARDPDKELFIRYIGGLPGRVKLQHNIEEQIDRGQRVFKTAFGTEIDITKGPSDSNYEDKASNAYFMHLVRNAINNPVQGTAADLMRYSVLRADVLLRRKAPNSIILQYVHDSGKFMVSEKDYDNVIEELREVTAYQVEDWIPIYCTPEEGVHTSSLKRFLE